MTHDECLRMLGLRSGPTLDDIKKAYRKRAFELHPDLNPAPEAAKKFQEVNEAYVLLCDYFEKEGPEPQNAGKFSGEAHKPHDSAATGASAKGAEGGKGKEGQSSTFGTEGAAFGQGSSTNGTWGGTSGAGKSRARSSSQSGERKNHNLHMSKEEVMSSVLRDPFARRVFEDIYSEIRKSGSSPKSRINKQLSLDWGKKKFSIDFTHGIIGSIRGWFAKQMDDEQVVELAVAAISPGAKIRLQIQQGMSGRPQTIEVTLPLDYMPGRPIRLRGLGRKVGPWRGDLYLRIVPKNG